MRDEVVSDNRDFRLTGPVWRCIAEPVRDRPTDQRRMFGLSQKREAAIYLRPTSFRSEVDCKICRLSHIYVSALTGTSPSDLVQSRYSASQHRRVASQDSAFLPRQGSQHRPDRPGYCSVRPLLYTRPRIQSHSVIFKRFALRLFPLEPLK